MTASLRLLFLLGVCGLLLIALNPPALAKDPDLPPPVRLLAKPKPDAGDTTEAMKKAGVTLLRRLPDLGIEILQLRDGVRPEDAIKSLRDSKLYEYVEADSVVTIDPPLK